MYWAGTNTDLRILNLLRYNSLTMSYYLPNFTPYYDYDFRNAQAIRLFEDIVWESAFSGYNFQEYLNVYTKYRELYDARSYKWGFINDLFLKVDRGYDKGLRFSTNAKVKDLASIGPFYSNSIQSEDYFIPTYFLNKADLSELAFINDCLLMDESYSDQKNLFNFYVGKAASPILISSSFNYPQSHHAILNNFRSDYEDFTFFQDLSLKLKPLSLKSVEGQALENNILRVNNKGGTESTNNSLLLGVKGGDINPSNYNISRFSNPIALRRSAKSSMVTYQAFQKVFKLRYDEGRAHVRVSDFSNSAVTQPYTTEQRIKYDRMLGKNKIKFFNTNFNTSKNLTSINDVSGLINSLNFYFYEFPFLDGVTNDSTRHV